MSILNRSPLAAAQKALETNPDVVASAANMAQSTVGLVPVWKASTAYTAGQRVISPGGDVVSAKIAFTSGATYSAANWDASTQDGRIGSIETAATTLTGRVTAAEGVNTTQNGRLTTLEGVAPKTNDGAAYIVSWTDNQDRVALGIKADGAVEIAGKLPATTSIKTTAVALTHAAGGGYVDARTAVHSRIPFKLGAAATIKAIHFRNYEDRSGLAHTGALSFTGVALGESARTAAGQLNGNFLASPTTLSGAFATPADGADHVLSGLNVALDAGKDYILSFGYTCAAQNNHLGVGGSWTNTTPANYAATTDALTIDKFTPLDVWLEIETTAPVVAWCGDSLSCGVAAELPGYQSAPMIHARANGYIPLMYTNSGSAMTSWVNASAVKYTKWAGLSKPEALVMSLSKNDFLTTTDMAVMRTRFDSLYAILTPKTSTNMYLTTCLPNASEADATGTAERAWNDILLNEQLGNAVNVFDLRKAVTAVAGGLDPVYDSGDGVHLNKRGYAALATAIPHNLTLRG